jgi:hypothetical protein
VSARASVVFLGGSKELFLGQARLLDAEGGIRVEDREDHCYGGMDQCKGNS